MGSWSGQIDFIGKYAKNDKHAGCNEQAGWGKMSETNQRSGWKKCNQDGGKSSNCVSTHTLLFDS